MRDRLYHFNISCLVCSCDPPPETSTDEEDPDTDDTGREEVGSNDATDLSWEQ